MKKAPKKKAAKIESESPEEIRYTDRQLIAFLDSVGRLPTQPLADKAAFGADSIFKSLAKPVSQELSPADFALLKRAAHNEMIEVCTAKRIFGELKADSTCTAKSLFDSVKRGNVCLKYYPFNRNKNKFDEFAIRVGSIRYCSGSELYFFKGDKIIAKQDGYGRYDEDIKYFKNTDGEAIVYQLSEFDNGSGIWWLNYFFYKYDGDKLIPVLNEVENANLLQPSPWGVRELWLESIIKSTNPLVMKMVYHQQLQDTLWRENSKDKPVEPMVVNDSTLVRYTWNEQTKSLDGKYELSKITKPQILSYYLVDNELLFINAYNKRVKNMLLDKATNRFVLHYLNTVKNYHK